MIKQPFKVQITHYDEIITVEKDHSDITAEEAVRLCYRALIACEFHPDNIKEFINIEE